MLDLREALADIGHIRAQVALRTQFRGYGPGSIAASGILALGVAALQAAYAKVFAFGLDGFVAIWVATAGLSVVLASYQMVIRARREHSGYAREMVRSAIDQFLPALVVGVLLTAVVLRLVRAEGWMLPGLWQLLFSLGVFASCRFLPRHMFGVGLWYVGSGLMCLVIASGTRALSPWEMGFPFGVGQLLVAAVLHYGFEESLEAR